MTCQQCNGRGTVTQGGYDHSGMQEWQVPCSACAVPQGGGGGFVQAVLTLLGVLFIGGLLVAGALASK